MAAQVEIIEALSQKRWEQKMLLVISYTPHQNIIK